MEVLLHHLVQAHAPDLEPAPAGISQHLARSARPRAARRCRRPRSGAAPVEPGEESRSASSRFPSMAMSRLLIVVRDAARQHAEALQLLRVEQLAPSPALRRALREVTHDRLQVDPPGDDAARETSASKGCRPRGSGATRTTSALRPAPCASSPPRGRGRGAIPAARAGSRASAASIRPHETFPPPVPARRPSALRCCPRSPRRHGARPRASPCSTPPTCTARSPPTTTSPTGPRRRGLVRIATLVRAARAEGRPVLLLDAGDAIQGGALERSTGAATARAPSR